ncbi:hypothetical protein ACFX2H_035290 [Malus domestica]
MTEFGCTNAEAKSSDPNQFFLASQQQQVLAQAQAQNNVGSSTNYGDMDPRRFSGLRRGSLNSKDGQSTRNDGSMFSLVLSSSPKVTFLMYLMRIRIHGCCWGSIVKDAVKSIVVNVPALCYENLVFSTFNGYDQSSFHVISEFGC